MKYMFERNFWFWFHARCKKRFQLFVNPNSNIMKTIRLKLMFLKKNISTLSEIKVQKLIFGWYLFKKYTVIPKKSAY